MAENTLRPKSLQGKPPWKTQEGQNRDAQNVDFDALFVLAEWGRGCSDRGHAVTTFRFFSPAGTGLNDCIDQERLQALASARHEGCGLAGDFYFDPEIYRAEIEQIWRGGWLYAGHTCQIPEPGDFFTYEIDCESILILRDEDHCIRAFYNLCRHRGMRLASGGGHATRFVCPYHQWNYDCKGQLCSSWGMGPDFDKSEWALLPVAVHDPAGFVYISLAENPIPFEQVGAQLVKFATPQGLERARIAKCAEYEIDANWKIIWENNRECYHCNVNHPQYIKANFDHYNTDDCTPAIQTRIDAQVERNRAKWETAGLAATHRQTGMASFPDPESESGWCAINRTVLVEGYMTETMDGQQAAPLMGDYADPDVGTLRMRTMPNMWNHSSCDHAVTTRLTPAGPRKTLIQVLWLVDHDAVEGRDYQLDQLLPFWQLTSEQDWEICEQVQKGIESRAYRPGPFSTYKEKNLEAFVRWYLKQLVRD